MSKVAVVYWSGTGNTEAMASAVVDGVRESGAEAELLRLPSLMRQCSPLLTLWRSDVRQWAANSLRTASSSLCLIRARVISEAKIALFGSYGWGDGEWMRSWEETCTADGAVLVTESVICNDAPSDDAIAECKALGAALAAV